MYANDNVILEPLTDLDAEVLYGIYSHPMLIANLGERAFLPEETPLEFTRRMVSLCNLIFTIRLKEFPQRVVGDCALHHWKGEKHEVAIGGSLLPECWGKGLMQSAFELLTVIAKNELGATTLLAATGTGNHRAIRLLEKMGFRKNEVNEEDTVMRKEI
jgi:ribosomal-protein-alanine N-acetyltransferase